VGLCAIHTRLRGRGYAPGSRNLFAEMIISDEQVDINQPANSAGSDARPHGGRLSEILAAIAADTSRARISIADLFSVLSHRAFGALMLIFAAPNIFPTPPGFSSF